VISETHARFAIARKAYGVHQKPEDYMGQLSISLSGEQTQPELRPFRLVVVNNRRDRPANSSKEIKLYWDGAAYSEAKRVQSAVRNQGRIRTRRPASSAIFAVRPGPKPLVAL